MSSLSGYFKSEYPGKDNFYMSAVFSIAEDFSIIAAAMIGVLGTFVTAFTIPVPFFNLVAVCMLGAATITCVVSIFRKKGVLALLPILAAVIRWQWPAIISGAQAVINHITVIQSNYILIRVLFPEALFEANEVMIFLSAAAFCLCVLLAIAVCLCRSVFLMFAFVFPVVVLIFIIMFTPPGIIYFIILIFAHLALLFKTALQKCGGNQNRGALIPALVLSVIVLGTAGLASPYDGWEYNERLREIGRDIRELMTRHDTGVAPRTGYGWPPIPYDGAYWRFDHTLSMVADAGTRHIHDIGMLDVTSSAYGVFYLRGFSMSYFDGRSWRQNPGAALPGENDALHMPTAVVAYLNARSEYMEFTYFDMTITQSGDRTTIRGQHPYRPYYFFRYNRAPGTVEVRAFDVPNNIYELRRHSEHLRITNALSDYIPMLNAAYTQIDPATAAYLRQIATDAGIYPGDDRFDFAERVAAFVSLSAEYSLSPPVTPDYADFAVFFLENANSGYCIHFATAAALMLRAFDIPTRFVTGFIAKIPPDRVGEVVSLTDRYAHAWVEVFLEDFGWVFLEATPATGLSVVPPAAGQNAEAFVPPDFDFSMQDELFGFDGDFDFLPYIYAGTPLDIAADDPYGATNFALLIIVSVCVLLIIAGRIVIFKLRQKSFMHTNTNMAVINVWKYLSKLNRRKEVSEDIELLALKARFSQHTIDEYERENIIRYAKEFRSEVFMTETLPVKLWLRLRML